MTFPASSYRFSFWITERSVYPVLLIVTAAVDNSNHDLVPAGNKHSRPVAGTTQRLRHERFNVPTCCDLEKELEWYVFYQRIGRKANTAELNPSTPVLV